MSIIEGFGSTKECSSKTKVSKKIVIYQGQVLVNKGVWVVLKKMIMKKMFVLGFMLQDNLRGGHGGVCHHSYGEKK